MCHMGETGDIRRSRFRCLAIGRTRYRLSRTPNRPWSGLITLSPASPAPLVRFPLAYRRPCPRPLSIVPRGFPSPLCKHYRRIATADRGTGYEVGALAVSLWVLSGARRSGLRVCHTDSRDGPAVSSLESAPACQTQPLASLGTVGYSPAVIAGRVHGSML